MKYFFSLWKFPASEEHRPPYSTRLPQLPHPARANVMALFRTSKGDAFLCCLKPFLAFEVNIGIHHFQRFGCNPAGHEGRARFSSDTGQVAFSEWRKLDSRSLGIRRSMISTPSWIVLKNLHAAGFKAYLVGGCVRDLLLNKIPKDFDVITTASLRQVKRKFRHAMIVGRRFPICRVSLNNSIVEVSSFETAAEQCESKQIDNFQMPKSCDPRDYTRWKDSIRRDFTVNSLFFDPFLNLVFDYTNGMADLKSLKLRTVIPANVSFKEDEARILRGLRLAARLNLSLAKETEVALYNLSLSVAGLSTSRISLEMNYMLAYGAAEPSLRFLKRFKLLEILLPFHAAYISEQMNHGCGLRSLMLMKLFANLDQLIACDRPCNESLWVAILVFHLTLFGNPQPTVVILTLASLLCHGNWKESVNFARGRAQAAQIYVPEILDNFDDLSDDEIIKSANQFARHVEKSVDVLIKKDSLWAAMARFPEFPPSGLVFVSQKMGQRVRQIFDLASLQKKNCSAIDYPLLIKGDTCEIRFVLGKIILSSMISGVTSNTGVEKDDIAMSSLQKIPFSQGTVKEEARQIPVPQHGTRTEILKGEKRSVNADRLRRKRGSVDTNVFIHSSVLNKVDKDDEHLEPKARKLSLSSLF